MGKIKNVNTSEATISRTPSKTITFMLVYFMAHLYATTSTANSLCSIAISDDYNATLLSIKEYMDSPFTPITPRKNSECWEGWERAEKFGAISIVRTPRGGRGEIYNPDANAHGKHRKLTYSSVDRFDVNAIIITFGIDYTVRNRKAQFHPNYDFSKVELPIGAKFVTRSLEYGGELDRRISVAVFADGYVESVTVVELGGEDGSVK